MTQPPLLPRLVIDMSTLSWLPPTDVHALGWATCRVGDRCVVSLCGELDVCNVTQLRSLLKGVVESGTVASIVVDMSRVEFVDAASVGVVVGAAAAARRAGVLLRVAGLRGLPERVFRLLGLEELVVRRPGPNAPEGWADAGT